MTTDLKPDFRTGTRIVRIGEASWSLKLGLLRWSIAGLVATGVLFLIGLSVGFTTPVHVARIILGGGTTAENIVIFDDVLPRVLVGSLAGFSLALAGCLTQIVTRNPLATPDMLGITSGASAGAVLALTSGSTGFGAFFTALGVPTSALIGGLFAALLMYALAWTKGQVITSTLRLILIGVGLTWMMQAVVGYVMTRADVHDSGTAQKWLVGSLASLGWSSVITVGVAAVIGIGWSMANTRSLAVSSLGPDIAQGLGVRLGVVTYGTLITAVVVASLAVSVAGPIAFVGLVAPQIALRLAHTAQPTPMFSGLVGAAMVLTADIVCRTIAPAGLPVGVITAAVGGPFLVLLIIQSARRSPV
ncbi:MAG: iron ABC transporter permease [Gordonia sp. (in: high G+C Gram-positive bacteria)]|uniref:FecCD family ABC transporter permease n=1 Tax=Gordonia sp. (in: high G+C Gram-positive bacteria) TaxID=84139 RepID=UPI003C75BB42